MLEIIAIILIVTSVASFINTRYLRLIPGIGVMLISLLVSLLLIGLDTVSILPAGIFESISLFVNESDFNYLVIDGMLGALLFAAALHVEIEDLLKQKYVIALLASVGLLISTFMVAGIVYYFSGLLSFQIPFIYALIFGALISPTDPIAVLAIFKTVGAPKSLETKVAGESLFNDGVAIVLFIIVLGVATGQNELSFGGVASLFVQEAVGGTLLGLLLGYVSYMMLKAIDDYNVEILITLALVFSIYIAAHYVHVSGPVASVVAGLLIGNHGKSLAMSKKVTEHLDQFWHFVDEILNAVLFVLLGMEIIVISFDSSASILGVVAIISVLLARLIGTGIIVNFLRKRHNFTDHAVKILTWAGMRGGISVALALSLPESAYRETILTMTYIVVVFSILVQGLTIPKVMKKYSN